MHTVQVLMAVFNGEKFIEEQILSIMNQSYPDVHLIVRDNHSEDQTCAIVKSLISRFPKRIRLIESKSNDGVIGNFARLAEAATASYVMFSDADDVWKDDKIAKTMAKLLEMEAGFGKEKPLLVHTDLTVVDRHCHLIHPSFWEYSHLKPELGHSLPRQLVQNVVTGCTVLINRALLDAALPFPNEIVMHDWWLGLVACALGEIDCLDESTMFYRQHGYNDTGAKKYGLFSLIARFRSEKERSKVRQNFRKKFAQAKILHQRYADRMTSDKRGVLEAFMKLPTSSFFQKRHLMVKFKFYKQGFLRNLLEFLPAERWLYD